METLATLDKDNVTSVSFSPDGSLLTAASPAFEVRLESDQLCQNHSVVHSLTGCNEYA